MSSKGSAKATALHSSRGNTPPGLGNMEFYNRLSLLMWHSDTLPHHVLELTFLFCPADPSVSLKSVLTFHISLLFIDKCVGVFVHMHLHVRGGEGILNTLCLHFYSNGWKITEETLLTYLHLLLLSVLLRVRECHASGWNGLHNLTQHKLWNRLYWKRISHKPGTELQEILTLHIIPIRGMPTQVSTKPRMSSAPVKQYPQPHECLFRISKRKGPCQWRNTQIYLSL